MTENLFYQILKIAAIHENRAIKKVSSQLTWTNPVMEVKLRSGNLGDTCLAMLSKHV